MATKLSRYWNISQRLRNRYRKYVSVQNKMWKWPQYCIILIDDGCNGKNNPKCDANRLKNLLGMVLYVRLVIRIILYVYLEYNFQATKNRPSGCKNDCCIHMWNRLILLLMCTINIKSDWQTFYSCFIQVRQSKFVPIQIYHFQEGIL